jgi:hypothetical protein
MRPTERGAFCNSCQKEVIDFTSMTDREVMEYLSKNKLGCSRFRSDQLDRNLTIARIDNGVYKWRALALSLLSLVSVRNMMAQTTDSIPMHQDSIPTRVPRHSQLSDTLTLMEVTVTTPPCNDRDRYKVIEMGGPMFIDTKIDFNQTEGLDGRKIKVWFRHLFRRKKNEQKKHTD